MTRGWVSWGKGSLVAADIRRSPHVHTHKSNTQVSPMLSFLYICQNITSALGTIHTASMDTQVESDAFICRFNTG